MDAPIAKRRWYLPTPAWLVWGAAAATGVLYACERWRWFPVHYQKGWPVLLAVAVAAAVLTLILAWILVGLVFRRRVQFGLRTMLVFVTLCAVVCSWMTVRIKQARRQAEAVAAVLEKSDSLGVWYDRHVEGVVTHLDAGPPIPDSLKQLLGVDFFADVDTLYLSGPEVTDATLADLVAINQLKSLQLQNAQKVTDAGISHLEGITSLSQLYLWDTKMTDVGLRKLQLALPGCTIDVYAGEE